MISELESSFDSVARIHSTAGGSPCTRTIFLGDNLFGIIDQRLTRGVRAELELFDIAADALGGLSGSRAILASLSRLPQKTGRRFWIGIADKKNRMLRVLDDSPRKNIGECFWNHHSAGEHVNASRRAPAASRTVSSFNMNGAASLINCRRGNCRRVVWVRRS